MRDCTFSRRLLATSLAALMLALAGHGLLHAGHVHEAPCGDCVKLSAPTHAGSGAHADCPLCHSPRHSLQAILPTATTFTYPSTLQSVTLDRASHHKLTDSWRQPPSRAPPLPA